MLRDRNIAFFIDVDNVGLTSKQYADIIGQLNAMGSILCGKVYGAGDRKHKEIYADADLRGYKMERPMRIKRRGRKDFDARIFVDVVDALHRAPAIDAVCIIAEPTDLVYLYGYLHARGIKIVALNNVDEASGAFIDEVVELAAEEVKPVAKKPAAKPAQPAPAKEAPAEAPSTGVDRTDELLKEIERLRSNAAPAEEPASAPVQEEKVDPAPQETPAPRAAYTPASDGDLLRRIEELRNSKGDSDDYIDEIRKLLDGLE
ncbi:MAG: NYN domain-containing protein [Clostridiales bacterium]|nr:NYN domain-containing protein [Clostridiales bacterium]